MTEVGRRRQASTGALDIEATFDQEFGYVWNTLRRFGVRESDLPDATQEVFVKLYELGEAYDPARPLRPWLCAIAFRVSVGQRRRAHVRREVFGVLDTQVAGCGEGSDPEQAVQGHEARDLVLDALQHVEPDRRVVLVMHDIDGTSMPDIVAALGIPLNTGYSRLRLARAELAQAVRARHAGGEP